jgi:hypothetical protein
MAIKDHKHSRNMRAGIAGVILLVARGALSITFDSENMTYDVIGSNITNTDNMISGSPGFGILRFQNNGSAGDLTFTGELLSYSGSIEILTPDGAGLVVLDPSSYDTVKDLQMGSGALLQLGFNLAVDSFSGNLNNGTIQLNGHTLDLGAAAFSINSAATIDFASNSSSELKIGNASQLISSALPMMTNAESSAVALNCNYTCSTTSGILAAQVGRVKVLSGKTLTVTQ